jgi:hypothetical protein
MDAACERAFARVTGLNLARSSLISGGPRTPSQGIQPNSGLITVLSNSKTSRPRANFGV